MSGADGCREGRPERRNATMGRSDRILQDFCGLKCTKKDEREKRHVIKSQKHSDPAQRGNGDGDAERNKRDELNYENKRINHLFSVFRARIL